MNSNLEQLDKLTWNYQLWFKINILTLMTNLQIISLNGHFSSHMENITMHHNPPNIYIALPSKSITFFRLKNGRMPSYLPSYNIYQQKIPGQHINISKYNITTYLPLPSHQTQILNYPQQKETMKHYQDQSESRFVKDDTIPSSKLQKPHVKITTYMNNDNGSDLLIYLVSDISPQIGGLAPKAQDLVISSHLVEG